MSKLIVLVGLCVGGIVFVVTRFFIAQIAKSSTHRMISRVKKDPLYIHAVAADLDIPISNRKGISETDFRMLKQYLTDQQNVGNYRILHIVDVSPKQFLAFTEVSYVDFATGVTGHGQDVKKIEYLNFLISLEGDADLIVRSSIYHNTNEKFLKEGFLMAVFDGTKILEH